MGVAVRYTCSMDKCSWHGSPLSHEVLSTIFHFRQLFLFRFCSEAAFEGAPNSELAVAKPNTYKHVRSTDSLIFQVLGE